MRFAKINAQDQLYSGKLVNSQPLYAEQQLMKPYPLSDIKDIRIQEALIIKDLMYVLLGLEGSYIRYSDKFHSDDLSMKLAGPDYKISKHLDPSLKDVTKRIVRLAKMYYSLTSFTDIYNNSLNSGQVIQSFINEIRNFIKIYVNFINSIGKNFKFNKSFTLRELEQDLLINITFKMEHFYELILKIIEINISRSELQQQDIFNNLIGGIRTDLKKNGEIDLISDSTKYKYVKGGLALTIVQDRLDEYNGDLKSFEFLSELFNNISKNYIKMLNDWLTKGIINDPNNEFFITSNLPNDFKLNNLNSERYWDSNYEIKKDGLPKQFQDKDIQLKVLLTGKYLNVLKNCDIKIDKFSNDLVSSLNNKNLNLIVDNCFNIANSQITELFFSGYDISSVLLSLKQYFFLNNSNHFRNFLKLSFNEFKKNYKTVSVSKLNRNFSIIFNNQKSLIFKLLNLRLENESIYSFLIDILKIDVIDSEEALNSKNFQSIKNMITNAINNKEREIAKKNENKSIENLRCINYFNFDLIIPFPLNLIINRTIITQFQLVFRHLINLQFTDELLTDTWMEINKNKIWKFKKFDKSILKWILRSRSLHDRMKDLIRIYFGFLSNDLIEVKWDVFFSSLNSVKNFNDIQINLQSFLNTILKSSILTNEKLIKIFSRLLQIINAFCLFLLSLRKVLILLNFDLFEKYSDRLRDQEFNYGKNLERLERLNTYLNEYLDSFSEHLNGFIEGLRYYGELECSDFLILVTKLENAYPAGTTSFQNSHSNVNNSDIV